MNKLITPESQSKRVETIVKIVGTGVTLLILGPLYLTLLHGMMALGALFVTSVLGFVIINIIPAFAAMVGTWRLKALKAVASANPIEVLEARYEDRQAALLSIRDNIKKSYAVLQDLWSHIEDHQTRFPGKPSQYLEKYNKLKALVELRGKKYKQAQANLVTFGELIEEKRSDWKIAQTMAEASKLANVGEDFQSKLMQDTALNSVQDGLNLAFSELETSLLDEGQQEEVPTRKLLAASTAPPDLDLDFEPEKEPVTRRHR